MLKSECENEIFKKMNEIIEVYQQYNPGGKYLSLAFTGNVITFNNEFWSDGEDRSTPIDYIAYK